MIHLVHGSGLGSIVTIALVIVVAIYIVVVLFLVRPSVRRSGPSVFCPSVRPSVGQLRPLLRPLRPFVWSKGAARIVAGLVHDLVINQYGRADDIICQAAGCGQCFPTAVPHRRRSPRCYRLSFRRHPCAARATFIAFLQHAENTVAGGSRLRCPL